MNFRIFSIAAICFSFVALAEAEILEQEGNGFLELKEGQSILHVKGSSFERGYQHGKLLKAKIQHNVETYIDVPRLEQTQRFEAFDLAVKDIYDYIPSCFKEELKGIAEGSEVPLEKILSLNLFPELFHCSGITVYGDATKDRSLYHVRVLDYIIGENLHDTAILMVAEPDNGYAFLNVTYAGFIGSITGMNEEKIAIGEISGQGYGFWKGVPLALLMRQVLESAETLEKAQELMMLAPRTCEYYYVISDGKTNRSLGCYATESQIHFIEPGTPYAIMAQKPITLNEEEGLSEKFALSPFTLKTSSHQTQVFDEDNRLVALYHEQPTDCVTLVGFTHPERYPVMIDQILKNYGEIDENVLQQLVKELVDRSTNLNNAIFWPEHLKVWISHAADANAASNQPYSVFSLKELIDAK